MGWISGCLCRPSITGYSLVPMNQSMLQLCHTQNFLFWVVHEKY
jgi:hypothetical protein